MEKIIVFLSLTLLFIPLNAHAVVADTAYKEDAYLIKEKYYELKNILKSAIKSAENSLSAANFENDDAKDKIDTAWSIRWMAWETHGKIDSALKQTEYSLDNKQYQISYNNLLQIDKEIYSTKDDLYAIKKEVIAANNLEQNFQEKIQSCFLFWCSDIPDTYNKVNSEIQDLEIKLKTMENKLSQLKSKQNTITEKIHKYEIADKNLQIKKLEKIQEQEKAKAQTQQRLLQEQIRKEQDEIERQEQLRIQEQYEADRQERQLQVEIKQKEKQKIIEKARTNPVIDGLIDGTIYFYIEPIPSYYKVPGIHQSVEDVASSLERKFYGIDIRRTYNANSADIVITWVKDFGSSKLGHAIFKKFVEVELGSDKCWGEWQPYDTNSIKKILWHEIGHSLGYSHSSDPNNVMYESTYPQLYQSVSETFALEGGYSRWFSFCNSGAISFHAESSKDTDGFNVYAIPSDDPRGFSRNGGSTYLTKDGSNCGNNNIISITRYCNVGSGAYLHFKNTESHTIYITFEMYDKNQRDWPNMTWDKKGFQYDTSYINYVRGLFR